MKNKITKGDLRKEISVLKKEYTSQDLIDKSDEVFSVLEIMGVFQSAKNIFIYNSISSEVSTQKFIEKWIKEKNFYLPVVCGDELVFCPSDSQGEYTESSLGIKEPVGTPFVDYKKVDLVIVPGLAFDRKMNRLGRGKGYYDRFLKKISATKVGICFDFQLFDSIPFDQNDVKMDMIISENDLIW